MIKPSLVHITTKRLIKLKSRTFYSADKPEQLVGLEIHLQLNTKKKLFSNCLNNTAHFEPNENVGLFDLAFPGVLPILNVDCVRLSVLASLCLNAQINHQLRFDRKHYFYHDLPLGYQITQKTNPIAKDGYLEINELDGLFHKRQIKIKQIQLEQDTGMSNSNLKDTILVNFNRANSPLIEIVTLPEIKSETEAEVFVNKLSTIMRCVGVSECSMDKGSMRVDVNISTEIAKKKIQSEVKNIGTIKGMVQSIKYEYERQKEFIKTMDTDKTLKETRVFDQKTKTTKLLRVKDTETEYRYLPEGNIPIKTITEEYVENIRRKMPEYGDRHKHRLIEQYSLSPKQCDILIEARASEIFEKLSKTNECETVYKWLTNDVFAECRRNNIAIDKIEHKSIDSLLTLVRNNVVTNRVARNILKMVCEGDKREINKIIEIENLYRIKNIDEIQKHCNDLIRRNKKKMQKIGQNEKLFFEKLHNELMFTTKGKIEPNEARSALENVIKKEKESLRELQ